VADGVRRAADALRDAGYEVVEGEPPRVDDVLDNWLSIVVSEFRGVWPLVGPVASEAETRFVEAVFAQIPPLEPAAHGMAYVERQALAREWAQWMTETPLVLAPCASEPPWEVDADLVEGEALMELVAKMRLIAPSNGLGLPSAAVGAGEAGGLPQGVQVIGPRWREDACLDAAEAIESALGTLTPIDPR
jgi:amidase